jgi:hypothetical protein
VTTTTRLALKIIAAQLAPFFVAVALLFGPQEEWYEGLNFSYTPLGLLLVTMGYIIMALWLIWVLIYIFIIGPSIYRRRIEQIESQERDASYLGS